jgi:hypothetical protein
VLRTIAHGARSEVAFLRQTVYNCGALNPTDADMQHPFPHGHTFLSPGNHFTYRVIGPCCRLFDREELPWPCCRIQWRGKEPSWRRIGKRLIPDLATQNSPSYAVEIVGTEATSGRVTIVTLYAVKLSPEIREWWHSRRSLVLASEADHNDAANRDTPVIQK